MLMGGLCRHRLSGCGGVASAVVQDTPEELARTSSICTILNLLRWPSSALFTFLFSRFKSPVSILTFQVSSLQLLFSCFTFAVSILTFHTKGWSKSRRG